MAIFGVFFESDNVFLLWEPKQIRLWCGFSDAVQPVQRRYEEEDSETLGKAKPKRHLFYENQSNLRHLLLGNLSGENTQKYE